MPHDHRTSKEDFPHAEAKRLRQQGQSIQKIADTIGWSFSQTRRNLQAAVASEPSITDIPVEPVELTPVNHSAPSAPESAPLVPVVGDTALERSAPSAPVSAPRFDDLESRVEVLEAFIATLQRQPSHIIGALNGAPRSAPTLATKKRGFVIACDLSDAVDAYASASGQRVTDILDRALRLYLGEVAGTEVHP